jgi:hypothetical protein
VAFPAFFPTGPEDLLQLAAAAALEQQQDQAGGYRDQNAQQYDATTLAAMQQYDPSWAAAYAGMPMGMMNMNYYWPTGCIPGQYTQQKHPSLTKPEHQGKRRLSAACCRQCDKLVTASNSTAAACHRRWFSRAVGGTRH